MAYIQKEEEEEKETEMTFTENFSSLNVAHWYCGILCNNMPRKTSFLKMSSEGIYTYLSLKIH